MKLLCGVFIAFLLAACKSPASLTTTGAAITKTEEAFFSSVVENSFRFNTLSARMKLEFIVQEQELSSRAQLKMIYNDRLQISIQPLLGVEAFRIELTDDSVKILDRLNKRFMVDSYNNIKGTTDIDFNFRNLQALFTNQIFVPGENDISARHFRRFRMTKENSSAELKLRDKNGVSYTFVADSDEKLLSTNIDNTSDNQSIAWDYTDFQIVNKQPFPLKMTAHVTNNNKMLGTVIFSFSTPEINSPLKTDFNIPSGFVRVTSEQMIKLLINK